LPVLATELVLLKPDTIVTTGTPGALAAMQATNTIPIIMASSADPVKAGIVTNLARPGGNVTGRARTLLLERERIKRDTIRNRRLQHQKNAAYNQTSDEPHPLLNHAAICLKYSDDGHTIDRVRKASDGPAMYRAFIH